MHVYITDVWQEGCALAWVCAACAADVCTPQQGSCWTQGRTCSSWSFSGTASLASTRFAVTAALASAAMLWERLKDCEWRSPLKGG